jgi:histone-lysine N-methyltransferase SUV420H
MSQILKLPGLKQYSESFRSPNELEDFHCHMEKYLAIYLPDCPFKILSTYRYSFEQQAMIVARKRIVRGEEIRYLCGTTVSLHKDELAVLKQNGSNFSIIESKWKGSTSLMLGPLRFVNHSKKPNARLNLQRAIITAIKDIEPCQEITASYGHEYFGPHNQDCVREIHPQQNHGSNSMPNRKRAVGQISSNPQKEHSAKRVKR